MRKREAEPPFNGYSRFKTEELLQTWGLSSLKPFSESVSSVDFKLKCLCGMTVEFDVVRNVISDEAWILSFDQWVKQPGGMPRTREILSLIFSPDSVASGKALSEQKSALIGAIFLGKNYPCHDKTTEHFIQLSGLLLDAILKNRAPILSECFRKCGIELVPLQSDFTTHTSVYESHETLPQL